MPKARRTNAAVWRTAAVLWVCGTGCRATASDGSEALTRLREQVTPSVRDVRVLIADDIVRFRLHRGRDIAVIDDMNRSLKLPANDEWTVVSADGPGRIHLAALSRSFQAVALEPLQGGSLTLSVSNGEVWEPARRYPGCLRLRVDEDGRLQLVNSVDVERYVACVVAQEVWPDFDIEAFRAQAIAARTFVLYQMIRRSRAPFDVTATQGSQVYRGVRADATGRRAARATMDTFGLVCTFNDRGEDRLFPAFYSAACGGMTQSATIFGSENDIEPLAGEVPCDFCRMAPAGVYRWGPVRIRLADVQARLARRYPEVGRLGHIRTIDVLERTPSGRPLTLRIVGSGAESYDLSAERFRQAVGPDVMQSTDCEIHVGRRSVVFRNGKGSGHGLGLCQWGMQGQALGGKRAGEILRYYYPGATLTRVY